MAITDPPVSPKSPLSQLIFWGALALVVAAIFWMRYGTRTDEKEGRQHPAVGTELPALELQGLTGAATDVDLTALRGNVVLINFWGTWCPPCRLELPHIAQLRREFATHQDFRLLAVSCPGRSEDLAKLRSETQDFLAAKELDLPTYADPKGATRRAVGMALGTQHLDIPAFPTTVLLDRKGVIRAIWEHYEPGLENDMRRAIEEVLTAN